MMRSFEHFKCATFEFDQFTLLYSHKLELNLNVVLSTRAVEFANSAKLMLTDVLLLLFTLEHLH